MGHRARAKAILKSEIEVFLGIFNFGSDLIFAALDRLLSIRARERNIRCIHRIDPNPEEPKVYMLLDMVQDVRCTPYQVFVPKDPGAFFQDRIQAELEQKKLDN